MDDTTFSLVSYSSAIYLWPASIYLRLAASWLLTHFHGLLVAMEQVEQTWQDWQYQKESIASLKDLWIWALRMVNIGHYGRLGQRAWVVCLKMDQPTEQTHCGSLLFTWMNYAMRPIVNSSLIRHRIESLVTTTMFGQKTGLQALYWKSRW
jgi:hypothetical protein